MLYRIVFVLVMAAFLTGCGSEKERNRNRDRDRPQSGEKEKAMLRPQANVG
jgi:hypothetical protein